MMADLVLCVCVSVCACVNVCMRGPKCQTGRGRECAPTGNVAVHMWNVAAAQTLAQCGAIKLRSFKLEPGTWLNPRNKNQN